MPILPGALRWEDPPYGTHRPVGHSVTLSRRAGLLTISARGAGARVNEKTRHPLELIGTITTALAHGSGRAWLFGGWTSTPGSGT